MRSLTFLVVGIYNKGSNLMNNNDYNSLYLLGLLDGDSSDGELPVWIYLLLITIFVIYIIYLLFFY